MELSIHQRRGILLSELPLMLCVCAKEDVQKAILINGVGGCIAYRGGIGEIGS